MQRMGEVERNQSSFIFIQMDIFLNFNCFVQSAGESGKCELEIVVKPNFVKSPCL